MIEDAWQHFHVFGNVLVGVLTHIFVHTLHQGG